MNPQLHASQAASPPELCPEPRPADFEYESFLADMSFRFTNLPTDLLDGAIEEAQRFVCHNLGLECSTLYQHFESAPDMLILTHVYDGPANPLVRKTIEKRLEPRLSAQVYWVLSSPQSGSYMLDVKPLFPWVYAQLHRGQPVVLTSLAELPAEAGQDRSNLEHVGAQSVVIMPLLSESKLLGCLTFGMLHQSRNWSEADVSRLRFIGDLFTNALVRRRMEQALQEAYAEMKRLKERLQLETEHLKSEMKTSLAQGQTLGRSGSIRKVLREVEQVATAECPVLVSGETGTGKELIAQEIHRLSLRKDRFMVLVNCAALPSALVESELFGRERGAYTGAMTSQIGRFEVANGSTIFLDEVGELSMEVQAKLLRVLQQGELQRLGSPKTRKVDVRVIAATNRDLAEEVRKGRFREDLYYRLRVFPIQLPPLRERVEDIPLLVFAFMEEFATRMGKKVTRIPRRSMELLQAHSWPGNIRELRNVIEHSVILATGDTLKLTSLDEAPTREAHPITLADAEKAHILRTLESTAWRIKGPHGAALRLGLQPSTLYSRMEKLGIPHRRQREEMGL